MEGKRREGERREERKGREKECEQVHTVKQLIKPRLYDNKQH